MLLALLFASTHALASRDIPSGGVFKGGLLNITCYRIPAIVRARPSARNGGVPPLVAFAEARHASCSDNNAHEVAVRRSLDGTGKEWETVGFAVGNDTYRVGNPTAITLQSGRIALFFRRTAPTSGNGVVYSDDDGATWSEPVELDQQWGPASGASPGPGTALQLDSGRVLVVAHHGAYIKDQIVYTDDEGATWTNVRQEFPKMDEAQMTQLKNGSVLVNMRHTSSPSIGRGVSVSNDGGETWGPIVFDKTLVGPVCQASITTIRNVTYFSNPASATGRIDITIRRSTDDAQTWPSSLLVQTNKSAGYSCMVPGGVNDKQGGILFEAPGGGEINFALFPLEF